MNSISTWIYAKLEWISGVVTSIITGTATILSEPPQESITTYLIKAVLVVVFGFLGAAGAWLWKELEKRLKKKK